MCCDKRDMIVDIAPRIEGCDITCRITTIYIQQDGKASTLLPPVYKWAVDVIHPAEDNPKYNQYLSEHLEEKLGVHIKWQ